MYYYFLSRLATDMSDDDYRVLTGALSTCVPTDSDQGWEEATEAGVTHLLRTTLSKNNKETGELLGVTTTW